MTRYVAFLRAVNVGKRTVDMTRVKQALAELGLDAVGSFVNSGNLLFTGSGSSACHESRIRSALEEIYGFELTTFIRTAGEVTNMTTSAPFGEVGEGHTHFVLMTLTKLTSSEREAAIGLSNEHDEVALVGRDLHWLIKSKSTETTLGPKLWKRALPDNPTTARNVTMLNRLVKQL